MRLLIGGGPLDAGRHAASARAGAARSLRPGWRVVEFYARRIGLGRAAPFLRSGSDRGESVAATSPPFAPRGECRRSSVRSTACSRHGSSPMKGKGLRRDVTSARVAVTDGTRAVKSDPGVAMTGTTAARTDTGAATADTGVATAGPGAAMTDAPTATADTGLLTFDAGSARTGTGAAMTGTSAATTDAGPVTTAPIVARGGTGAVTSGATAIMLAAETMRLGRTVAMNATMAAMNATMAARQLKGEG